MLRTLIYPSSGACDCVDELLHLSSCSQFVVCWSFCCGWYLVVFVLQAEALLQPAKRTQRTENKTTDVVIHQHSRKLLKIDILESETCWAHNKWNKIASDIKLVFHLSTIAMMHGPINIKYWIGLHNSGLLHPLSTRSLLVALELYEHRKIWAEWHTHFSVVLSILLVAAHLSDIIFKKWLENVMLFHVAYHCLASYNLIFN